MWWWLTKNSFLDDPKSIIWWRLTKSGLPDNQRANMQGQYV